MSDSHFCFFLSAITAVLLLIAGSRVLHNASTYFERVAQAEEAERRPAFAWSED